MLSSTLQDLLGFATGSQAATAHLLSHTTIGTIILQTDNVLGRQT